MQQFRRWLTEPFARRLGLATVPQGPVNTRMLGRTLALELAQRPGGLLAAKIARKHVSVTTTEGYAARPGGSQAMFHAEVRQAEHDHHLRLTVEAYEEYRAGQLPAGPGARALVEAFEHVESEVLRDAPAGEATVFGNERRIENLLRQRARTLHIGSANYCWFADPAKALCLRMAGTPNAAKPLVGMCDSARCTQATHHLRHRAIWQDTADTAATFLGNPRVPKGEKPRLRIEYECATGVLDAIDDNARTCGQDQEQHT
ncbi:hypothetical protein [Nocardia sp. NPDC047038]|uniref:hypothetical protein n=1 Tax=Nocardia sp. NPDC047038 TaxID=3154338 RepID=UPI0033EBD67F